MAYQSVDQLQKILTEEVFHYAQDKKKAAGRALGTLVEVITFYLLKAWGLNDYISIESRLSEYGNSTISHNVEYTLHPVLKKYSFELPISDGAITANRLLKNLDIPENFTRKNLNLLSQDYVLRNACTIATSLHSNLIATIDDISGQNVFVKVCEQGLKPFAMFECKRVGVEEGTKKGPQTIEKAKQGAYVARSVSSVQKVRTDSGELYGITYADGEIVFSKPYEELLDEIIESNDSSLLKNFILTIGVVSNHGNWFTANDPNKELKVLAQSYDWLVFLTDRGLAEFINELILHPAPDETAVREAFLSSYSSQSATKKNRNQFTKVSMHLDADLTLRRYFTSHLKKIENWFNILSPATRDISTLKTELHKLASKKWGEII